MGYPSRRIPKVATTGTYYSLGQYEEALGDYAKAIALDPSNVKAYYNRGALLADKGMLEKALIDFEKAVQLGLSQAEEPIAQIKEVLGKTPAPPSDPAHLVVEAFVKASSLAEMVVAVSHYSFMTDPEFMARIEQVIAQKILPEHKPAFTQKLSWLKQIAAEKGS